MNPERYFKARQCAGGVEATAAQSKSMLLYHFVEYGEQDDRGHALNVQGICR
jgi:hypothetical protein